MGVHHYRGRPGLLGKVLGVTFAVQAVRILSIWAAAKAVGIDLDPRIYYVFGPLLFLVMLVPLHAQRARGARGVLRQLPRLRRSRREPGVRAGFLSSSSRCSWRSRAPSDAAREPPERPRPEVGMAERASCRPSS
jgi:hypothetical protein